MDTPSQGINMEEPQKGGVGQVFGIVIIIAILIIGGIYFWTMKTTKDDGMKDSKETSSTELENELDLGADANIDAEMNDINSELSN